MYHNHTGFKELIQVTIKLRSCQSTALLVPTELFRCSSFHWLRHVINA